MERVHSPTSAPVSPAAQVAMHAVPVLDAEAGPEPWSDPWSELRDLSAALRSHLGWLREGGITGLPRSPHKPARSRPAAPQAAVAAAGFPAPPESSVAARPARPLVAEHTAPPRYAPSFSDPPEDAAAAAQAALQASARAASAPSRGAADRG